VERYCQGTCSRHIARCEYGKAIARASIRSFPGPFPPLGDSRQFDLECSVPLSTCEMYSILVTLITGMCLQVPGGLQSAGTNGSSAARDDRTEW
jgi:hypothetical protein